MKIVGQIFGILALMGMLLGMIPLLGWFNWINIPFAILGLIFSIIGKSRGGIIICLVAIFIGGIRLLLGGGFI